MRKNAHNVIKLFVETIPQIAAQDDVCTR